MAVQTVDDFLSILEKSKLVTPSGMQQIRKATVEVADAKAVARFLIQRGILTRFQAMQLLAGRHALQLGPYRLRDRIASGGTGAVYAAQSAETKQLVTLKILPRKLLEQENVAGQLKKQVAKSKLLEHPNLCRATELGREGDQIFVLMEAAEGQGLRQRVETDGPLPFDTAAKLVQQAAAALAVAHDNGLVHGDLTPDHLVCSDDDQVKLVDVGTAGLNPAAASADYAAPEVSAESPPTAPSDIYSLGCTLYFLLTGKPPFPEGTAEEKRAKHQTELPASVLELRSDAPPELMKLTIRMMAKEPGKRIESAAVVAAGIDEWLSSLAASAAAGGGASDEDEDSLTDASDEDATDPDVDRALAEAMAASNFDDELDEPPPEIDAAAGADTAAVQETASSADDLLAEALAASEFDNEIEDEEKVNKRKARLGDMGSTDDDMFDDIPLRQEEEEPEESAPEEEKAEGGTKIFGFDVSKLLGTGGDPNDPAAKKKKLIVTGAAGGLIAVVLIILVWMYVLPMFSGDGKKPRRRDTPPPVIAQNDPQTPLDGTDTPTPEDGTETEPDGTEDGTDPDGTESTDGTGTTTDEPTDGTETPPTDGSETPPGDGTETPPDDGSGTETVETPVEPPVAAANPFTALATSIDLPTGTGTELATLGPVDLGAEAECTASLIGGEVGAVTGTAFTLQDMGASEDGHSWIVKMSADGAAATTVGRFLVKDGELAFQWARGMDANENARVLRQLGLKMQSGANVHVLALRAPFARNPIVADFQRSTMRELFDLEWTGDQQALIVEITSFEGDFPEHEFKDGKRTMKAAGDSAVIFFGDGDDKTLAMKADVSLTPKLALALNPFFKVKTEAKSLPFNASNAARVGNGISKNLEENKSSLETLKTKEQDTNNASTAERLRVLIAKREAEVTDLELAFEQMKQLSAFALAVHGKGKIHYRVYYQVGDDQVDLVRTESPAAEGATP